MAVFLFLAWFMDQANLVPLVLPGKSQSYLSPPSCINQHKWVVTGPGVERMYKQALCFCLPELQGHVLECCECLSTSLGLVQFLISPSTGLRMAGPLTTIKLLFPLIYLPQTSIGTVLQQETIYETSQERVHQRQYFVFKVTETCKWNCL